MASGGQRRTRSERVAALEMPPGPWERAWISLRRRDVLGRMAAGLSGRGGRLRRSSAPGTRRCAGGSALPRVRDVTAGVTFSAGGPGGDGSGPASRPAETPPRSSAQDPQPLGAAPRHVPHDAGRVGEGRDAWRREPRGLWREFQPPAGPGRRPAAPAAQEQAHFQEFRKAIAGKENLDRLEQAVAEALAPFERRGLLGRAPQGTATGPTSRRSSSIRSATPSRRSWSRSRTCTWATPAPSATACWRAIQPELVADHVSPGSRATCSAPSP